jgi:hypothetical protein
MRSLFWNSELWTPLETQQNVNSWRPQGIFICNEGPRLIYGDATHLIAWWVKELRIEHRTSGEVVLEWTAPPGIRYDSASRTIHHIGEPLRRQFVWGRSKIQPPE